MKKLNKKVPIIGGAVIGVILVIYIILCFLASGNGFIKNMTINGIKVNNMSKDEVVSLLEKQYKKDQEYLLFNLKADGKKYQIDMTNNVTIDIDKEVSAIQKKYNLGNAYVGKAGALKDLKKDSEYLATLKEGIEAAPENKTLKRLHANYYLNAGIKAQKANKLDDAEEAFKQVLADDEKNTNALYSLGTLSYNKAALVLKNAAPLANSDKAKYDAQKEIADKNFQNAKTYLERALPLLSADKPREKSMIDNIKKLLPQIEAQLK